MVSLRYAPLFDPEAAGRRRMKYEILDNTVLIGALISWSIAIMAKTLTILWRDKTVAVADIFGPGGMPSTHTCPILTAVVLIGFKEGWDSSIFALGCTLASVVMYDASGIRRAAGQHAQAINMIFRGLFEQGHLQNTQLTALREILGHQPAEVMAGAALGIIVGVAVNNLTIFGQG